MRAIWNNPLGREIMLILMVKIIAIGVIWWAFFRPVGETAPLDAKQVSAVIINKPQDLPPPAVVQPAP